MHFERGDSLFPIDRKNARKPWFSYFDRGILLFWCNGGVCLEGVGGWNILQAKEHSNRGQALRRVRASNRSIPVGCNRHGIAIYQTRPATYLGKSISYVARVVIVIGGTILLLRVRLTLPFIFHVLSLFIYSLISLSFIPFRWQF